MNICRMIMTRGEREIKRIQGRLHKSSEKYNV